MNGRCVMKNSKSVVGGSVLLNGSAGSAGTYTSASPQMQMGGAGLSKNIAEKLSALRVQPNRKKPSNISFSI